jgi:hypothetical protein
MPRCRLFFSLELAGDRLYYIHQVSSYGSLICSPTLRQSRSFDTYAWTCLSTTNLLVLPTATFPSAYARSPVSLIFPALTVHPYPTSQSFDDLNENPTNTPISLQQYRVPTSLVEVPQKKSADFFFLKPLVVLSYSLPLQLLCRIRSTARCQCCLGITASNRWGQCHLIFPPAQTPS